MENDPQVPSPVGRGWKAEEDAEQLVIDWMEGQPAPDTVLNLLACNCSTKCSLPRCVCVANGIRCTDMCRLKDCENRITSDDVESSDEEVVDDLQDDFDD